MNRKTELNKVIKESITIALLELMNEKPYDKIKISEITEKAGVARISYYRNYKSKDDIFNNSLQEIYEQYTKEIRLLPIGTTSEESLTLIFRHTLEMKDFYIKLYDAKLLNLLVEFFNTFMLSSFNQQFTDKTAKYGCYIIAGAFVNTLIQWLKSKEPETPEQIAQIFCDIFKLK